MLEAFKKLFEILPKKDRLKFVGLFVLMLIGTLLEVIGIGMIPIFISAVADPELVFNNRFAEPILSYMGIENQRDLLISGGILLVFIFLVKTVYLIGLHYCKSKFIHNRFAVIASRLFQTYMFLPYTFHLNRNTAELIRNVTNETRYISNNVMKPLFAISMESVTILGIFTLLMFVEPVITLLTFLILGGAAGLVLKCLKNNLRKYGYIASEERTRMIQAVNEGLGGVKDIAVMNRQSFFIYRFNKYVDNLKKAEIFRSISHLATKPFIELIAVTGMMIIAMAMVFQGRPIAAIIPVLTLFGAATVRLMPAVSKIVSDFTTIRYYIYALNPVHEDILLSNNQTEFCERQSENKIIFKSEIKIDNVFYQYPNSAEQALNGVDLVIQKGSAVGFIGASGAGKSTIVDIILGLLKPQNGRVLVDDICISDNMQAWQQSIGYIPQYIYLSDDSIRNNIAFGIPEKNISNDKIEASIKAAQLEDVISTLENGVNTIIGERGTRLSGGQRQRIGIARAIYHNPSVLLMDEATSALDNVTERQIIKAIEAMKGERTIIMIAHRLTTVKNCDQLFLMENGKNIYQGKYNELINKNEMFKEMSRT